ncbi:FHA domain-containing protein [Tersicoccus phoenicis]|uniref:FHA domain-containing protein n=1 Tax=Tersicoccus phoenicis TaxID=554083 RepID=A0A1R1L9P6_9MICC|nr:FHA domain-containing protein [Tersicoccus phoenicis]
MQGGGEGERSIVNTPRESSLDTTSINVAPVTGAQHVVPRLSPEEQASIEALPGGSALLIAHQGPNAGARFLLDQSVTTAGRHPNADIFLDDVTVSRRHVEFRRTDDGFDLVDSRSLNGTYVNGDRVDRARLTSGDEVRIGKFRLTFYPSRAAAAAGARGAGSGPSAVEPGQGGS